MSKKKNTDLVFDDDTSDSEDDLEAFRNNMKEVTKDTGNANEELDSDDSKEEDDGSEEEDDDDDDSDSDDDYSGGVQAKDDSQIKSKLGKLGSLLSKDDSEEDESDEDIEDESDEEDLEEGDDSENELDENDEDMNNKSSDNESDEEALETNDEQTVKKIKKQNKRKNEEEENVRKKPKVLSEEEERARYRNTLSKLSVEEILKIKESLGSKVFDNKWSGKQKNTDKKVIPEFKRENKNRPREISSKVRVPKMMKVVPVSKDVKRDPRFDPLCGEFDKKEFKRSYKFLTRVKEKELKVLKSQLKGSLGEDRDKLKYLIQRTENQLRAEKQTEAKEKAESAERKERKEALLRGEKPVYKSKKTKREEEIVKTYEKLKDKGGLEGYIKKKSKKNSSKDKKMMNKM